MSFYPKQDYSLEGKKKKEKEIAALISRRVNKQFSNKEIKYNPRIIFYPKQDYSKEGQIKKSKEIKEFLDKKLKNNNMFNFQLSCEKPSFISKIISYFIK